MKLREKLSRKLRKSKGFTLIEMLVVIAIIAILVVVSVPMVNSSLTKAKNATDDANERAAKAAALIQYMTSEDNLKAVMRELNAILQDSMEYSLTFQEEEAEENDRILIRRVTIPFTCSGYAQAQEILTRLHDSSLRCMIENLQILQQTDGNVRVTAVIAFYEYQTNQA